MSGLLAGLAARFGRSEPARISIPTRLDVSTAGIQCLDCNTPVDVVELVGKADDDHALISVEPCGHVVRWPLDLDFWA